MHEDEMLLKTRRRLRRLFLALGASVLLLFLYSAYKEGFGALVQNDIGGKGKAIVSGKN